MNQVLRLSDGRDLEFLDSGQKATRAVVLHIGTPGTASVWQFWIDEFNKLGIRTIALNRAGYGKSSRNQNTTIAAANADTAEVLKHLGITDFVSVGWSGGGPSTLADAMLDNCIASNAVATISSLHLQGESFFADYAEASIQDINANLQGWDAGFANKAPEVEELRAGREAGSAAWWQTREKIEEFRADYDAFGLAISRGMAEAVDDGGLAWQDDETRFLGDWGFTFNQIKAPVHFWQGSLDTACPESNTRWLAANIPGASLTVFADETHTTIMVERRAEIFDAIQKQLQS